MGLCVDSVAVLDIEGKHTGNSQHVMHNICSEVPEIKGVVTSPEDIIDVKEQMEPEDEESRKSESRGTPTQFSDILGENDRVQIAPWVVGSNDADADVQPGQEQTEKDEAKVQAILSLLLTASIISSSTAGWSKNLRTGRMWPLRHSFPTPALNPDLAVELISCISFF